MPLGPISRRGPAANAARVSFRLPLFDWLSQYRVDWLRPDVLAGLTTAAVVIPKAMAYATVAGLPIEIGIYTAIVPALVYAVLGTSRVLSVTTTTTIAILVGTELAHVVPDGDPVKLLQALATLALMVGFVWDWPRCCGSAFSPTSCPTRCRWGSARVSAS